MGKDKRRITAGQIRERGAHYLKQLEEVTRGGPFPSIFYRRDGTAYSNQREFENDLFYTDLRFVKDTELADGTWISTVWTGIGLRTDPDGRPLIFQSTVFSNAVEKRERFGEDYATEEEALAGHDALVAELSAKLKT